MGGHTADHSGQQLLQHRQGAAGGATITLAAVTLALQPCNWRCWDAEEPIWHLHLGPHALGSSGPVPEPTPGSLPPAAERGHPAPPPHQLRAQDIAAVLEEPRLGVRAAGRCGRRRAASGGLCPRAGEPRAGVSTLQARCLAGRGGGLVGPSASPATPGSLGSAGWPTNYGSSHPHRTAMVLFRRCLWCSR